MLYGFMRYHNYVGEYTDRPTLHIASCLSSLGIIVIAIYHSYVGKYYTKGL